MNDIEKAKNILLNEDVVAIPTETVYGLAGRIDSDKAINQIFKIKDRPFFDPLIVHVSSVEMAIPLVKEFNSIAKTLSNAFWPGPLALILEKSNLISDTITSGLDRVAIRMPNHRTTLDLIEELGSPLAAPSANKFKKTSPTSKEHVFDEFGEEVFILDGGESNIGIESTVVGIFDNKIEIYRPGMITKEEIQKVLPNIEVNYKESPVAPGQLKHHYMPNLPLTICDENFQFNPKEYSVWTLEDDPIKVARELYSKLRELDKKNKEILFILKQKYKDSSKWEGILNRLNKAKTKDYYFINR